MNERIKELAKKATTQYSPTYYSEKWVEKFAELIVQECAQVCLSQRDPANLNYKPSEKFAAAVKEHFGVE